MITCHFFRGESARRRTRARRQVVIPVIDPRRHALRLELERRPARRLDPTAFTLGASVSLLVRPQPADLEILLIQRPISTKDPWSGHMAFPGGRLKPGEEPLDAAIRETQEEVGVDLEADGISIGRLDDVIPSGGPRIAVSPFVFAMPAEIALVPDPVEVASTVWMPLKHLSNPASAAEHLHIVPGGDPLRFPALAYGDHVIWGLTYRMLIQFLGITRAVGWEASS